MRGALATSLETTTLHVLTGGWATTRDAEHGYRDVAPLLGAPEVVATTFAPDPADDSGRTGVAVVGAGSSGELPDRARVFRFPGLDALEGRDPDDGPDAPGGSGHAVPGRLVSVADLVEHSGLDEVRGLAGLDVGGDDVVHTLGFVRPVVERGRLVLLVRPAVVDDAAVLVPFEQRDPTPCCADH